MKQPFKLLKLYSVVCRAVECEHVALRTEQLIVTAILYIMGWLSRCSNSLRAGRSEDRIPPGSEIFRTSTDRSWDLPSLLYNEYRVSFLGVKRPGRVVNHPRPSSTEVKERVGLYLYSHSGSSWPVLGRTLPLPFIFPEYKA
jgi:hypothetical protein